MEIRHPRCDTASRLIKASPATIYDAFVPREAVAQWLPPQDATMEIQVFESCAGGRFQMTLTLAAAPGKSMAHTDVVVRRFVELVPQQRIVQAFEFNSPDPAFAGAECETRVGVYGRMRAWRIVLSHYANLGNRRRAGGMACVAESTVGMDDIGKWPIP